MRILVVSALLGLTASCAWPPPEAAAPPPVPSAAFAAPLPLVAPPPPAVVVAEPPTPVTVAAEPAPPARQVEYVPVPLLWWHMLAQPAPAGRLMLSNFSFEPTRIQAVLETGPACAVGNPGTATEFVLPPNGTQVIPAPPGADICWRRQQIAGETREIPPEGPWTAWSRAYTGPGRFLDAVIMTPSPPAAMVENAPPPPPPVPSAPPRYPK